jgi:glyoxylase-like metal-dependent hydrolase (beta-lactamase superfamily II)
LIRFGWGELQLTVIDAGPIWLDGGAMFGVVPRPLWQRERTPDEQNRIRLSMNLLLIEDGHRRTLIDTGVGPRWDAKSVEIYGLQPVAAEALLAPLGLKPSDIDRVINSHLHFDHAGGNVEFDAAGVAVPAFPRAEYLVQRGELKTARSRNERTRGSYRPDDFESLVAGERLRLIDGDAAIDRWIQVRVAPGHTPHMQIVHVVTEQGTLAFLADLVPTTSHLRYPYIMAYDLEPLATLASKKRWLGEAVAEGWWVVFEHDDRLPVARLITEDGRIGAALPAGWA